MTDETPSTKDDGMSKEEFNKFLLERNLAVAIINYRICLIAIEDYAELNNPKLRKRLIEGFSK